METVTRLLAEAWTAAGHQVCVATREEPQLADDYGFVVLRRPGPARLLHYYAAADSVILQGLTLRLGWPLLLRQYRATIVHHFRQQLREAGPLRCLRARLGARACHVTVSKALDKMIPWPVDAILPNPYDDAVFRVDETTTKTRDIIFVGRLIFEKGAHILIEALGLLRQSGLQVSATIVGDGPQCGRLSDLLDAYELRDGVHLAGCVTGSALAHLLNQHRIMVVPSLGEEAFGIVALEGIACGCVLIASDICGLPEAIGSCGRTFPAGDKAGLAKAIRDLLSFDEKQRRFRGAAEQHLARHKSALVAQSYLDFLACRVANAKTVSESCALSPRK